MARAATAGGVAGLRAPWGRSDTIKATRGHSIPTHTIAQHSVPQNILIFKYCV